MFKNHYMFDFFLQMTFYFDFSICIILTVMKYTVD